MDIFEFNPWWETGEIDRRIRGFKRRDLFYILEKNLNKRFIDVIVGLRRVGKTTLMYHLIDSLLRQNIDPKKILYFSFDIERRDLKKILDRYETKVLGSRIRNEKCFLFFDEIHKLEDWANKVKVLYDLNPSIKIILSGSASLNLLKKSHESLAGRAKFHTLNPLSFSEFLRFKGERIPREEDFEIHRRRLAILFSEFQRKGFPETLEMSGREIEEYVRELVVERILYRDIPEIFRVEDTEILKILASYIFRNPGVILNVLDLSRNLGRHKKTIRNALLYLELSFLIKRISNIRGRFLTTSRKNRKGYPIHSSLAITRDEDKLLETVVRSEIGAEYYWRKNRNEIDFILKNGKIVAIEVKNKEHVDRGDLKSLIKFYKNFKPSSLYIVYRGEDKVLELNGINIKLIPVEKFLLFEKSSPIAHRNRDSDEHRGDESG